MNDAPTCLALPMDAAYWLGRVAALGPKIAAGAADGERIGRVPDAVMTALHGDAIFRLLLPREFGGAEVSPPVYFQTVEAIAKHDASTAWCVAQGNGCAMLAAYVTSEVAETVWGRDPRAILSWGQGPAEAHAVDGGYRISGVKHFGSGSGITSYMTTTARAAGEDEADWFYMDVRGAKWDGSGGMRLTAEWDGHGMAATQSHGFEFSGYPATRIAWPGNLRGMSAGAGAFIGALFTAVVVGVTESAVELARKQIAPKHDSLRPYEQVEWARVETESWLINAAYENLLRRIEAQGAGALLDTLHAKTAIAELAESVTGRICKIIGGGTFGRGSPFGFFFEDVRALGFLRPPWGLVHDQILERTWAAE